MGCHEDDPIHRASSAEQIRKELLGSALRPIITEFLETLDYKTPLKTEKEAIRAGMLKYAVPSGVPYGAGGDKHAHQCFSTGLSVAAVSLDILFSDQA